VTLAGSEGELAYRLGVDVGGTFTDLVLFDPDSNALVFTKCSSTPDNQAIGVAGGVARVARLGGVTPAAIEFFAHGTTVATNALLERKGAACALLVTEGFRDLLLIARQDRPDLYDWFARRPAPLIPRRLTFEIRERMLHTGEALRPLDKAQAVDAIRAARAAGVTALAVCLLHAYANPAHERRLQELIREEFPEALVSLSSDILPEIKEYERATTTAANAYVMPTVRRYIQALQHQVADIGVTADVRIMQSNGGLMTARAAGDKSVLTVLSGPAAGVIGAVALAGQAGFPNAITVDMGGTSFDICLAYQGQITYTQESEIGTLPLKIPMIDIHTLGAGGGSVAWIDSGGALRVGPRSAGAVPGPACYGRGGAEPTVTDANLVLGRLDAAYFLGGELALDPAAARRAIEQHIATPLGLSVDAAAEGIVRVVNATMARGVRNVSVERGYDPRDFALVAFGGGGPLHAADLARDLGIPHVLVPLAPGVTSALGLLMADHRHDFSATYGGSLSPVSAADLAQLARTVGDLEAQAREQMRRDRIPDAEVVIQRSAQLRYRRQGFELEVPVPGGELDEAAVVAVCEDFHQRHVQQYGYAMRDQPIVLATAIVSAVAHLPKPRTGTPPQSQNGQLHDGSGLTGGRHRPVNVDGAWVTAAVLNRAALAPGARVSGPAVIEQADSTAVLLPGDMATVDPFGNLVVAVGCGGGTSRGAG
jgi:N-methylhydantoinase A